eukprot:3582211-Pleurochrysis_carterae.AAC.1
MDERVNRLRRDKGRGGKQVPRAVDGGSASAGSPFRPPSIPRSAHSHTPSHRETDKGGGLERPLGRGAQPNLVERGA